MKRTLIMLAILTLLMPCILLVACSESQPQQGLTTQPQETSYPVISVSRYIKTKANVRGGIISQDTAYTFVYTDAAGNAHTVDGFVPTEHGLRKLQVGKEDKYVIRHDGVNEYRVLYLTQETLNKLTGTIQ